VSGPWDYHTPMPNEPDEFEGESCERCHGTGAVPHWGEPPVSMDDMEPCPECDGEGRCKELGA
jgi:DnaJ-class molecular chaperone